jgi:proliferating cell nuclear antigen
MKLAGNDDSITLRCEEDPSHLQIVFENTKQERVSEFNLHLMTLEGEQLGIPETDYSSVVTINSGEFSKICKELYSLSEAVKIETTSEFIKFSVDGEVGQGSIQLGANDSEKREDHTTLNVTENVELSFALRYLNLFNKAAPLTSQVTLNMSPDQPLVTEFKIENLGSLKYYLAPKISDE